VTFFVGIFGPYSSTHPCAIHIKEKHYRLIQAKRVLLLQEIGNILAIVLERVLALLVVFPSKVHYVDTKFEIEVSGLSFQTLRLINSQKGRPFLSLFLMKRPPSASIASLKGSFPGFNRS
jgi:hypothetical protein